MTFSNSLRFFPLVILLHAWIATAHVAHAQLAIEAAPQTPVQALAAAEQVADQKQVRVWIDVRSWPEHLIDSIAGDMHIHYPDIVDEVRQRFPDTKTPIALYCAAGVRAERARQSLLKAGYSDVINIGSLAEARAQRGMD